jgi:hypothetical protein
MLEQPPERSPLEIEAEAAAAAINAPQRRPHGCFRLIVWCMPTFLFYACVFAVAYVSSSFFRSAPDYVSLTLFGVLVIGLTYGVGFFDGFFSPHTIAASPAERQKLILLHALRFTAYQILLIPAISFLLAGACMAVASF